MIRLLFVLIALLFAAANPALAEQNNPERSNRILVMLRLPTAHLRPSGDYGGGYGDRLSQSALHHQARAIARRHHLTLLEDWPMPIVKLDCFVMRVANGTSTDKILDELSREPGVEWSQPMQDYMTLGNGVAHDDPLYPAQPARTQWRLDILHHIANGQGAKIAVIDSGIDTHHPDLAGQIADNRNFMAGETLLPESHGTAVTGIIAARADNGVGIAGIAPAARILGMRACKQLRAGSAAAVCDSFSLAKALHYAIDHKADIINLSLGGPPDRLLAALISVGLERGLSVVAAFDTRLEQGGFPASQPGVIAVSDSAVPDRGHMIYVAPGHDIPAPQAGGGWTIVGGSSYAAAHVSGLLALVEQGSAQRLKRARLVVARGGGQEIDAIATLAANGLSCGHWCTEPVVTASGGL